MNHVGPSIASMSLGGGGSYSMDQAVRGMVAEGVAVSVAAGNSYDNACYYSPAREPQVRSESSRLPVYVANLEARTKSTTPPLSYTYVSRIVS